MDNAASAAIHIQGPTIRWAEVVQEEAKLDLRRFGEEAFGVDLMAALRGEVANEEGLQRAGNVVETALGDTEASLLRVVVHPLDVFSFFTPVSANLAERDRMRRVVQQAALVTGTRSPDDLRISPRTVRGAEVEGERVEWMHVLAVPSSVSARIDELAARVPVAEHEMVVSTRAAAQLLSMVERQQSDRSARDDASYSLAVGQYSTHTEYTVTKDQEWYHAHVTEETRLENQLYYAVGFLNRVGVDVEAVGRLFGYGPEATVGTDGGYAEVFDADLKLLDPSELSSLDATVFPDAGGQVQVPCFGAVLGREEDA